MNNISGNNLNNNINNNIMFNNPNHNNLNNSNFMNNSNNVNYGYNINTNEPQIAAYLKRESGEYINKKFLITGASSGVGRSLAYYLLNNGAKVLLCGRDIETLKKIGEKFPNQASACEIDLIQDLQIYDLKTSAIEVLGGIDTIINCAGIMFDGDLEKTFPQDYDYTIDINLRSLFVLLKCLDKFILPGCQLINISCFYGNRPISGMMSHNISKAGLEMFTKYAAMEFASRGVRVNAISAGLIDSNALRYSGISDAEYNLFKTKVEKNIPIGRMAFPDDIAKAVLFLCSKRSQKITGQVIKVDGGRSLTSSGFVAWKGSKNMNSRFEPDGYDFKTNVKNIFGRMKNIINTETNSINRFPSSPEEIDRLINESNWSTRLSEAHQKLNADYKPLDQNDEFLEQYYMNNNLK
jgi:NAD(P)-dependent dehydrogenase (short-subunit alcohol dehydrogenase family)